MVETLIYIALVGITLTSFISFGLSISGLRNKSRAMEEVQADGQFALETLARTIRRADAVLSPARGATSSSLSLVMPDSAVAVFALEDGRLTMDPGTGSSLPIAGADIIFAGLEFANLGDDTAGDSLRLRYTATYKNEDGSRDSDYGQEFQTAVGVEEKL